MSKTKFYNLSALIILAVFQMWERIEGPSGLLINRFFDTVFLSEARNAFDAVQLFFSGHKLENDALKVLSKISRAHSGKGK